MEKIFNKQTRARFNSMLMAVLLLVLAILLAWLSMRYPVESDWTRNNRHTLSSTSEQLLNDIEGPLEITAYIREQQELQQVIKKFIARYQRNNPNIILHFVNRDAVPDEVRSLGIQGDELILRYQGRAEHVRSLDEQTFANALQRLLRSSDKWIVFIQGHGERNPLGKANHDVGEWGQQLISRGFKLQPLNLAQTLTVPDNTAVLVIAGPLVSYLPGEIELIINYLARGGNLLWLVEPDNLHGLEPLAAYLDITFQTGTIIDFVAGRLFNTNDPTITLVTQQLYGDHVALNQFNFLTVFPSATAISIRGNNKWTASPLITTGNHTWLERGELQGEISFDQEKDIRGPLQLGISLERNVEQQENNSLQQRVVIVGDGDFLSNTYIGNSGNLELGIRLATWLSSDDDFITIPARTAQDIQLNLSPFMTGIIGIIFLIILPLCLFGTGIFVWWRRKKL